MKKIAALLILTITIACCTSNETELQSELIFDEVLYQNHESEDLIIDTAYTVADKLHVKVVYSGCNSTRATLISKEYFKESFPVQLDVKIKLDDAGSCEKLIHDKFIFELTAVKERYLEQYREASGTVLLDIESYEHLVEYNF